MPTYRIAVPLIVIGTLLLFTAAAPASLVAYDGFESYGLANLNGDNAGTGWQGAWAAQSSGADVVSGGLSYHAGLIQINGGNQSVAVTASDNALFNRQLPTLGSTESVAADVDTSEIWFSFLFQQDVGTGGDFLNFWISNSENRNYSGSIGDQSTADPLFAARNRATGDANSTQPGIAYTAGQTYLLVGRISRDGASGDAISPLRFDQTELWVNPTSRTLGSPDAVVDSSIGINGLFDHFGLRTVNVGSGDIYRIDELNIGTDAASVLAIPEPATLALLAAGGLFIAQSRRRSH